MRMSDWSSDVCSSDLVNKFRTGEGQDVQVPMFECFTSFMLVEHLRDAALDPPIGSAGYPRQLDPTRQPFPTRDGYLAIVPYTPESTARLMALLGRDGLTETPDFQAAKAKGQNTPTVHREIARKTPAQTTAEGARMVAEAKPT